MSYCFRKFNKHNENIGKLAYDFLNLKECIETAADILETHEEIEFIKIYEINTHGQEKHIRTLKKIKIEETKKTVIEDLEKAKDMLKINRFNLQILFGEFEQKNRNVWYSYEIAIATISNLLFFTENLKENEK